MADAYIPYELCPELLEKDFTTTSLYNTLEQYGIYIYKSNRIIQIKEATKYEALHLNVKERDYLTVTQGIAKDEHNKIIEYTITRAEAKKMRIEATIYNERQK